MFDKKKKLRGFTIAAGYGVVILSALLCACDSARDDKAAPGAEAKTGDEAIRNAKANLKPTDANQVIHFEVRMDDVPEGELPFLVVPVGSDRKRDPDEGTLLWKFNPQRGVYTARVRERCVSLLSTPSLVWPGEPRDDVSFIYESLVSHPSTFHAELCSSPVVLGIVRAVTHHKIRVARSASGDLTCTWPAHKKKALYAVSVSHDGRRFLPIAVLNTKEPRVQIPRDKLLRSIERRHRAFAMWSQEMTDVNEGKTARAVPYHFEDVDTSSYTADTNGELISVTFSLIVEVIGRDEYGRVVSRASSEPTKTTISDAADLQRFLERTTEEGKAARTTTKSSGRPRVTPE